MKKSVNPVAIKKCLLGASLVAQWLGIFLPMQGTRVRALGPLLSLLGLEAPYCELSGLEAF